MRLAQEAEARAALAAPHRQARYLDLPKALRQNPPALLGAIVILLLLVVAAAGPLLAPFSPEATHMADRLRPPGAPYLLGTDHIGRDTLSRLIVGARISVVVGFGAVGIGLLLAIPIGTLSGYYSGIFDTSVQRLVDAFMAFPYLVVLLTLVAILGTGLIQVTLVIGLMTAVGDSRIVRSTVLAIRQAQFVEAARAVGAADPRILARHIFPNVLAPLIVIASISIGKAILAESSLSFLGFGVPPPAPSWGGMLGTSVTKYLTVAPWMAIPPGLAVSLTVLAFNLVGDTLRDTLDPRLRGLR